MINCHFRDKILIDNLTIEINRLAFCEISKVSHNEVERALFLAKQALEDFIFHPNTGDGGLFVQEAS